MMMMMERSEAAKIQRELAEAVETAYRETVHFGRTQDEHTERMRELVWNTPKFRTAPTWVKSALHGVDSAYHRMLYEPSLGGDVPPLQAVMWLHLNDSIITLDDVHHLDEAERAAVTTRHLWRAHYRRNVLKFWT